MPWRLQSGPTMLEKVFGGLSYFTFGMAGLIYMLLSKNSSRSEQFMVHMYQAALIWILGSFIGWASVPLLGIMTNVLGAVSPDAARTVMVAFSWIAIILTNTFYLLLLYGAVMAFLGKFAEVPFVSHIVRQNIQGRF